ncbi:hypothetical protein [Streptomyces cyaneofuscatus]|uniref:MFS transporter n=1 Tax=Streptomyces cyaneofuscatus TaxID=66883 RepID=A0ABZ1EVG0_9ACTN|nr:hypothetical protein [Streptomyces cyaneofuscatus]WSB08073.1 hypothetical protein OG849_12850 [Streptomyces cyaneofuscatus]WSD48394.1 hypothetical protein OG857_22555 [Streptomyces cyaneofuscatus]WTA91801.1 hypothetical protein OG323_23720 [Streptomyces cyaneofuscatus]
MGNQGLGAARPPYMLIFLGILFAVAPAVVWTTLARTRPIGLAIGGTLLAGAGLLIGVQRGWIEAPRPDAHLLFTALAPLLIACGVGLEGRHGNPPPPRWTYRRNGAIGFLGTQFALTLAVGLVYALLLSEGSDAPPSKALPSLPAGISITDEGIGCGSGGCYREATVTSEDGLSRPEIIRELGLQQESCRANGWLLDWRDVCVGARDNGKNVIVYATWGY